MNILLVDGDAQLQDITEYALRRAGHRVIRAVTMAEATRFADREELDVILLEVDLPDGDGSRLIRQFADRGGPPLIVVSARCTERDKVAMLDLGADDFLGKPISYPELIARIGAVVRRFGRAQAQRSKHSIQVDDLHLDPDAHEVRLNDELIRLTPTEFEVLYYLAANAGKVVTRTALLRHIWQYDPSENDEVLRVYISRLRRYLGEPRGNPQRLLNVRGTGYMLVALAQQAETASGRPALQVVRAR